MKSQIKNTRTNKKKLTTIVLIAVLIAGLIGYAVYARVSDSWPFIAPSEVDTDSQQDTQNESPRNDNSIKKSESQADENSGKTSDAVPISNSLTATITQLEQPEDTIVFAATITNSNGTGKCVLTLSNPNDRPVTKEFDATTKDSVVICGPVTIPALEFSYLGDWDASFRYYEGSEQAVATGKVTIK